jgi:hypothetical protein
MGESIFGISECWVIHTQEADMAGTGIDVDDKSRVAVFKRIDAQIEWYERNADRRMHEYNALKLTQVLAGGLIPVLSILQPKVWTRIACGALGAAIGAIESYLQFRNAHKNWPRWRLAAEELKSEKQSFMTRSGPYEHLENREGIFHKQVEAIIRAEREGWMTIMKSQPSSGNTASSLSHLPPVV